MSFAGPRVVQQTTRETLPEDFGLAESQLRLGHIDAVVPRGELTGDGRAAAGAVRAAAGGEPATPSTCPSRGGAARSAGCGGCWARGPMVRVTEEIRRLRRRFQERGEESQVWDVVQNARHQDRPYSLDYAKRLFGDVYELHGDRTAGDDPAIVAGDRHVPRPAGGRSSATRRAATWPSARTATSAWPGPEGYRKAIRAIELADRLGYPILTFVDTPGAYPGIGAEQAGQAGMIARSILSLARVSVPVVVLA